MKLVFGKTCSSGKKCCSQMKITHLLSHFCYKCLNLLCDRHCLPADWAKNNADRSFSGRIWQNPDSKLNISRLRTNSSSTDYLLSPTGAHQSLHLNLNILSHRHVPPPNPTYTGSTNTNPPAWWRQQRKRPHREHLAAALLEKQISVLGPICWS